MTKLTKAAVQDAFDTRLRSFAAGGDVTLAGQGYQPRAGRPYLSSRMSAYVHTPLGIGADVAYEASGTYQVNVNRAAIEGLPTADSIAARVAYLFRRGTALELATGAVLTVISASEAPEIPSGDWLTVPVSITWYASE